MKHKVWAHYHERSDKYIVYVCGHALKASDASIAAELAAKMGQKYFTETFFPVKGKPTKLDIYL